jgi:hypothetical protein
MRLDFSSVGCNNPFTNILTDLCDLVLLLMLLLNFLVLNVLSLLALLTMLLVVTKCRSVSSSLDDRVRWWHWNHIPWWRRAGSDG